MHGMAWIPYTFTTAPDLPGVGACIPAPRHVGAGRARRAKYTVVHLRIMTCRPLWWPLAITCSDAPTAGCEGWTDVLRARVGWEGGEAHGQRGTYLDVLDDWFRSTTSPVWY